MGLFNMNIPELIQVICAVMLSLTVHEYCHGLAAWWLGDPTAKNAGRLTINPIRHIDPIGLLCMIFFRFGWARPVPIDARYFRRPKRDMALVAAAGPLANLLLAFLGILFYYIIMLHWDDNRVLAAMASFFALLATLSVGFGVFNLLPIPPLDGSRIATLFLPNRWYFAVMRYERYIQLALLLLLYLGFLTRPLVIARSFVMGGLESVVRWMLL